MYFQFQLVHILKQVSPLLLTIQEKNWQHFPLTPVDFSGLSEGGFTIFGISSWFSFSSGGAF
jgi:hypothetical protein